MCDCDGPCGCASEDDRFYSGPKKQYISDVIGTRWEDPYCTGCGNTFKQCCCADEPGDRDF